MNNMNNKHNKHSKNNLPGMNQRNSLGMDTLVYTQLLKKLNQPKGEGGNLVSPHRYHTRLEYHQPYLDIVLESTDRSRREITVATRNISRGGLSVLHSSYTYPGTMVRTKLNRIDGNPYTANGKVVRCEHRGGVVHEIGISFDKQIIVQEFIRPDIMDCLRTHERFNASELKGKALIVGADKVIIPLIREYIQQTSINFGFAQTAKDALEKGFADCDIVCCCLDAGDMTGPEFARTLRTQGFDKPILLTGSCKDESSKNQVRLSTADCFIPSPINENDFLCALAEYLFTSWNPQILSAVRKHNCAQTNDALRIELAKLGVVLDQHIRTQDPVQIFGTCNKIKSIAPLLGLGNLREKAIAIGEAVANTGQTAEHLQDLMAIKAMCTDRASAA